MGVSQTLQTLVIGSPSRALLVNVKAVDSSRRHCDALATLVCSAGGAE